MTCDSLPSLRSSPTKVKSVESCQERNRLSRRWLDGSLRSKTLAGCECPARSGGSGSRKGCGHRAGTGRKDLQSILDAMLQLGQLSRASPRNPLLTSNARFGGVLLAFGRSAPGRGYRAGLAVLITSRESLASRYSPRASRKTQANVRGSVGGLRKRPAVLCRRCP